MMTTLEWMLLFIVILLSDLPVGNNWLVDTINRRLPSISFNRHRDVFSRLTFSEIECPKKHLICPCGGTSRTTIATIITTNQCLRWTSLGKICEQCSSEELLCAQLMNCTSCAKDNPHAICAGCPPGKHGLHCENEMEGCPLLPIGNGHVTYDRPMHPDEAYVPFYTTINVVCTEGFALYQSQIFKCSSLGQWIPQQTKWCVPEITCDTMCSVGKRCLTNTQSPFVVPLDTKPEIHPGQTARYQCIAGTFRKRNIGTSERICFYNGTLSGSEIECIPVSYPHCRVVSHGNDPRLKFCRGVWCLMNEDKSDNFQDMTYDLPRNIVILSGYVEFYCDDPYHSLNSAERRVRCEQAGSTIQAPRCEPLCGQRFFPKHARVIGGSQSADGDWPWQAALFTTTNRQGHLLCGASLIYQSWALTAAHCLTLSRANSQVINKSSLKLTYGFSWLNQSLDAALINSEEKYDVSRVILHENYDYRTLDNDIALIRLSSPVKMSRTTSLICLPASIGCSKSRLNIGHKGFATGWGERQNLATGFNRRMKAIGLYVANKTECEYRLKQKHGDYTSSIFTENMICATSNSSVTDTSDGDSGGPLVFKGKSSNEWIQEGIVSWGEKKYDSEVHQQSENLSDMKYAARPLTTETSNQPHLPVVKADRTWYDSARETYGTKTTCQSQCIGGYTRVSRYLDWITKHTGRSGHSRCAR